MTEDPARNVALLIDADNASPAALDPVLTALAEFGRVTVRRAYGNWIKSELNGWRDLIVRQGIEPQQQFDLTRGKNATDMRMTIDAMDLLYRGRVQVFGIMSSDSDFMPLATRLRQDGLDVYGFGRANAPAGFRHACTRFIDVDALIAGAPAPSAAPTPAAPVPLRPAAGAPAPKAPAPAKAVEVPFAESLPPPIRRTPADDPELLELLVAAYDAVKHDDRGYANLGLMGQLAANRSSFDTRNYGFKRLSDLIEAVPGFTTERREGQVFVRRVR